MKQAQFVNDMIKLWFLEQNQSRVSDKIRILYNTYLFID